MKPYAPKMARMSGNMFKILTSAAVGLMVFAAEPAMAAGKSGSKGKSASAGSNGKALGKGRGALARELKGLNAAHAAIAKMLDAPVESMPGKLAVYMSEYNAAMSILGDAYKIYAKKQLAYDLAEATLLEANKTLSSYSAGDEGYDAAYAAWQKAQTAYDLAFKELEAAKSGYSSAQSEAQQDINDALYVLTEGRTLSAEAITYMNQLLGLA